MSPWTCFRPPLPKALSAALLVAFATLPLAAQLSNGDVYGTVRDEGGTHLPGVTVEIGGPGATLVAHTDERGQFRFLGLDPGSYRLEANLDGYSPVVHESVTVAVGRNTSLEVRLLAAIEETITVTEESPILDERRISAGATLTGIELEKVPTARDPWALLTSVPGVMTNAVNIGGNKSGFQQQFVGTGSFVGDNSFNLDGMNTRNLIFDAGGANRYFDFGSFEEVEVSTGGTDVALPTGGVTLNLVTKRGTNQWRASARYLVADEDWQSSMDLGPDELGKAFAPPTQDQTAFSQGDRIVSIQEYGLEGGGPLLRDRLWFWGHYGKNDIDRLTINDVRDHSWLNFAGGKLNLQLSPANSAVLLFDTQSKSVDGRGAGFDRPEPTTVDQRGSSTPLYKLEDSHIASSSFFVNGLISHWDAALHLTPRGGLDGPNAVIDPSFSWQKNYVYNDFQGSHSQARVEGNAFLGAGEWSHELKFGASYQEQENYLVLQWPGDALRLDYYEFFGTTHNIVAIARREQHDVASEYLGAYAQDTLHVGNLTANVGLRYDRQRARTNPTTVPGVAGFETRPDGTPLFPEVRSEGGKLAFAWEDIVPRLGVTYALGENRETLLRASYSRFASQLSQNLAFSEGPFSYQYAYFYYEDANGDGRVTVDEIVGFDDGPLWTSGYDPLGQEPWVELDPELEAPTSDEVILTVEHSFLPELVVGLRGTWRRLRGLEKYVEWLLVRETGERRLEQPGDYELVRVDTVTLPDGSTRELDRYGLVVGLQGTDRYFVTNSDKGADYRGLSLTLDKRMSRRWSLRGHVTWSEWTNVVPYDEIANPAIGRNGRGADGGAVVEYGITPGWSYRLGGLVRVAPEKAWGFDVSGNLWGRQGYAIPYYVAPPWPARLATENVDDYRLPDLHLLDLSLAKELAFGDVGLTVALECFNVFNGATALARNAQLGIGTTNHVTEVTNPRIFRVNLKLSYR